MRSTRRESTESTSQKFEKAQTTVNQWDNGIEYEYFRFGGRKTREGCNLVYLCVLFVVSFTAAARNRRGEYALSPTTAEPLSWPERSIL